MHLSPVATSKQTTIVSHHHRLRITPPALQELTRSIPGAHLTHNVRQCILYDSPLPNARLIGIEYMITPDLYATLEPEERKRWHTHVFEVKSGMLTMPGPTGSHPSHTPGSVLTGLKEAVLGAGPQQAWETAETAEMEKVVELYGKIYHLWQTDRGDALPIGEPQLMTSFTEDGQFDFAKAVGDRDKRFGTDHERKRELRKGIVEPKLHEDADWAWKSRRKSL